MVVGSGSLRSSGRQGYCGLLCIDLEGGGGDESTAERGATVPRYVAIISFAVKGLLIITPFHDTCIGTDHGVYWSGSEISTTRTPIEFQRIKMPSCLTVGPMTVVITVP